MGGTGNGRPTNSIEKMTGDKWERSPHHLRSTRRDFCAVYYKNELVNFGLSLKYIQQCTMRINGWSRGHSYIARNLPNRAISY